MRNPKTVPATVEGFYQRTDSAVTRRICAELADALEQNLRGELTKEEYKALKAKLKLGASFYTPHAHFTKGYKSGEGGPVDSGKAIIDVDGNPNGRTIYDKRVKGREKELGINMMNISIGGGGFAVLFDIPEGLTRQEAQAWMAKEVLGGVDYDKAVHERERGIYIPCREYILYIDEELMFGDELHPATSTQKEPSLLCKSTQKEPSPLCSFPTEYHGVAFADIITKYWELCNDGKEPTEGDRDTLTYQLACDLRHICGRSFDWLDQVIPCYDGFPLEEKRQKIRNALQSKYEGMPTRLKQVLQALKSQQGVKACGGTLTVPPPMPKKLPPLIKLLTKNVPWFYKPAVASAVFPALGVHLHGVKFRYWDNVEHEATFMNVLIGRQSIGKGTIKKPIEYIMEDIRLRDQPNRQREADWKQKNPGAKQKKDPRPTDICIQMLIDNLTDAVFNQRIVDANNNGQRFIYTSVDEIEGLK